tara:strand:+ start:572 stop:787 length:216 start_codon:yes stop_codon:yes gene_type:complete
MTNFNHQRPVLARGLAVCYSLLSHIPSNTKKAWQFMKKTHQEAKTIQQENLEQARERQAVVNKHYANKEQA